MIYQTMQKTINQGNTIIKTNKIDIINKIMNYLMI